MDDPVFVSPLMKLNQIIMTSSYSVQFIFPLSTESISVDWSLNLCVIEI